MGPVPPEILRESRIRRETGRIGPGHAAEPLCTTTWPWRQPEAQPQA